MDIQTGDIILVRGKVPIISPLIRWFTKSEYTHVGVAINNMWIFEIDVNKRMAIHPIEHEDYDVFRYKKGLTEHQQDLLKQYMFIRAKESEGYDWLRIIKFAFERFFKFPFKFDSLNREVCSEITDIMYGLLHIDLVPEREVGDVRPSDIATSKQLNKVGSSALAECI
jgi:hypothetical protein